MHSMDFRWPLGFAGLLLLAVCDLPAATRVPGFPEKPDDANQTTWSALQDAVAATLPKSTNLTATDGAPMDRFGVSVALSGTTALVGANYKTIGSNTYQGAAYVFTFNGTNWVQQQELTASDGAANDRFGSSVALSGTTALVGAAFKSIGGMNEQGAAYVFSFNGSTWVQQQQLTANDGQMIDQFGTSVALSGTTALVGAIFWTIGANTDQGAAYVFTFNGSTWVQQQQLIANDGASNDDFGVSVALSGTTALVGAYFKTIGSNNNQGAAYVFTFNGSTWVQQPKLTASDGAANDRFGSSVALSGTTALVGAYFKTISSNIQQGAAYTFTSNGSTWVQQQELTASDGAGFDHLGSSVALSGTAALMAATGKTIGSHAHQGAAYVFSFNSGTWFQQPELTASNGAANDYFASSVALSGTTALVGAAFKTIGSNTAQGAAYVFPSDTIFCDGFNGPGM